jgi:hypothetical protein
VKPGGDQSLISLVAPFLTEDTHGEQGRYEKDDGKNC